MRGTEDLEIIKGCILDLIGLGGTFIVPLVFNTVATGKKKL